jgi:hypothetical protein
LLLPHSYLLLLLLLALLSDAGSLRTSLAVSATSVSLSSAVESPAANKQQLTFILEKAMKRSNSRLAEK